MLALLLLVPAIALVPSASAADPSLRVVNARTSDAYPTIQAALDAALAGDTITVPAGLTASSPATYAEALTISKSGITLCATVAVATCASHVSAARWSTNGNWATPPVAWQGEALNIGAVGSTSHFPNTQNPLDGSNFQIADIRELSFDFLLASGTCTGGSVRAQIGLNLTGTGSTRDVTIFAYPASSSCIAGKWVHHDLKAVNKWGLIAIGGPGASGTQAQAQSLAGPAHRVVSYNAVFDGSPAGTVGWFDNVRMNDAFYREAADAQCLDPQQPGCIDADARPGTIIDPAGSAATTIRITATNVTVKGFTIRNTGITGSAQGIRTSSSGTTITDNTIEGNPTQALAGASQLGIMASSGSFTIANNTIRNWAHSGIYASLDTLGTRLIENNVISVSGQNAVLIEGSSSASRIDVLSNDLRQARNANVRINTSAQVHLHENTFGVSQFTLDLFRFGFSGVVIDAQRNHWGAFTRNTIEGTIGDLALATVDVSCYYLQDGTSKRCGPTANFTYAPAAPHPNQAVQFTDTSISGGNAVTTWSWNFGDTGTSTARNPSHTYTTSGIRTVKLTVADSEGFNATKTRTIGVSNAAPVLDAIGAKSVAENALLTFNVHATDNDGDAITYTATGLPAGATLSAATGAFSWRPTFSQAGVYVVTFRASDGDLNATEAVTITVTDVDQAPTIAAFGNPSFVAGATGLTNVSASDADGDAVTLSATGLPAFGSFADLGNGQGKFTWTPTSADIGATQVTLVATANGLTTMRVFTVTVIPDVNIVLARQGDARQETSPGTVQLTAVITNAGSATDTFTFRTGPLAQGWSATAPADVTLAPGESASVVLTLTVPARAPARSVSLIASSIATIQGAKSVEWSVLQPILVSVSMTQQSFTLSETVSGTVHVTYLDGSAASGVSVRIVQVPTGQNARLSSAIAGTTNAAGDLAFDFGLDPLANLPGAHTLTVTATLTQTTSVSTSYDATVA